MTPALSRRLARAFTAGAATPDERSRVLRSLAPGVNAVEDLPAPIRQLVLDLESRGRTP